MATMMSNNSNMNGLAPCKSNYMMLIDTCAYEPVELIQHPVLKDAALATPVVVTANETALTINAVNNITSGEVKVVLFPQTPAEGDIFVVANSTPGEIQLKNAVADTEPVARMRPATTISMRYTGGKWSVF